MLSLMKLIRHAAVTDVPVLLSGEDGTEKELVAHTIHKHKESPRNKNRLVFVSCAGISKDTVKTTNMPNCQISFLESSGGDVIRPLCGWDNIFQKAKGGTLFLNNICKMGGSAQAALLDKMRKDLYFRLNVFVINLLPLRERRRDILFLAERYNKLECKWQPKRNCRAT